jgi:SAM-dependent methyltransferase
MGLNSYVYSVLDVYKSLSTPGKLLVFCSLFLLVIAYFNSIYNNNKEGFSSKDKSEFVFKDGDNIFDEFYANIYDYLVYNNVKNEYEIGQIINSTTPTEESVILDIGSATGHHVNDLSKKGYNVMGIDNSSAMIKRAKSKFPKCKFVEGDVQNSTQFSSSKFTHILCLYFTLYYIKNKERFFENCFEWLQPGGYLVVHLVDRERFNPIFQSSNTALLMSPQKVTETRIKTSSMTLDDFKYESSFKLDSQSQSSSHSFATIVEKFKNNDTGKVFRKQEHQMYMEKEEDILNIAKSCGFIIQGKIDMSDSGYEYHTLYILVKPN